MRRSSCLGCSVPRHVRLPLSHHVRLRGVPYLMVATGTGIAPMRAYIRRFFVEDVKNWEYKGLAWLFMGGAAISPKLSVVATWCADLLENEGLFTQGSQTARTFESRSVGFWKWTILIVPSGIQHHNFVPDPTLSLSR